MRRFRLSTKSGRVTTVASTVAGSRRQAVKDFKAMFWRDGKSEVTGWWWWRLRLRGEPVWLFQESYIVPERVGTSLKFKRPAARRTGR